MKRLTRVLLWLLFPLVLSVGMFTTTSAVGGPYKGAIGINLETGSAATKVGTALSDGYVAYINWNDWNMGSASFDTGPINSAGGAVPGLTVGLDLAWNGGWDYYYEQVDNTAGSGNNVLGSAGWSAGYGPIITLSGIPYALYDVAVLTGGYTPTASFTWEVEKGLTSSSYRTPSYKNGGGTFFAIQILEIAPPAPEMSILGTNSLSITNHSPATVLSGTDFGSMFTNSIAVTNTFVVTNSGSGTLFLTNLNIVVLTGDTNYFAVRTNGMATSIAATNYTTFTIAFNPKAVGTWTGLVTIANNDSNANPYCFSVRGTAIARTPHIGVLGTNSYAITNGAPAGVFLGTVFGPVTTNTTAITNAFAITNSGTGPLYLTNPNIFAISGDTSYFTVITNGMTTNIAAAGSTSFQISFNPTNPGVKVCVVTIANSDTNGNPYSFSIRGEAITSAAHMRVLGTNALEITNAAPVSVPEGTDFGTNLVNAMAITNTFAITNYGGDVLYLTSPGILALTGDTNCFSMIINGITTNIAPSASTRFGISYNPTNVGTWTGVVSIANSDTNKNPYSFSIRGVTIPRTPAIGVLGINSLAITNGAPAAVAEGSDFGIIATNSSLSHVFSITNRGTAALYLYGLPSVVVGGINSNDFSVAVPPSQTNVAAGGHTIFTVQFHPLGLGLRQASISIVNNDGSANPYTFTIQGSGVVPAPAMVVFGRSAQITNGDSVVSTIDGTDFGGQTISSAPVIHVFSITNTGSGTLYLHGSPTVAIGGPDSGGFSVISFPATNVVAGGKVTFSVQFQPTNTGLRQVSISIANSDTNANPYVFAVAGTGAYAPVDLGKYNDAIGINLETGSTATKVGTSMKDGYVAQLNWNDWNMGSSSFDTGPINSDGGTVAGLTFGLDLAWNGGWGYYTAQADNTAGAGDNVLGAAGWSAQYGPIIHVGNIPYARYDVAVLTGGYTPTASFTWEVEMGLTSSSYTTPSYKNGGGTFFAMQILSYGPKATNRTVSTITSNSACLNGTLVRHVDGSANDTNGAPSDVWVYWGAQDGGKNVGGWGSNSYFGPISAGTPLQFSTNITTLSPATLYSYRYLVTNLYGIGWAPSAQTFLTANADGSGNVWLTGVDTNASEAPDDTGIVQVCRTNTPDALNGPLTVYYTLSGTTTNGFDYQFLSGVVTIPTGEATADIVVTPLERLELIQWTRTVTITLASGAYTIGSPDSMNVYIGPNPMNLDPTKWDHRMKISFNYDRPEPLTNFMALVILNTNLTNFTYDRLAAPANAGDLRFFNADCTAKLSYEIEQWNTSGSSYIWVQVPELTNNACIWAYFGNTNLITPPSYATSGASWSTNFVGVWHMMQTSPKDSTAGGNNGAATPGGVTSSNGMIAVANHFDRNANGYVRVPSNSTFQQTSDFTISAWIYDDDRYYNSDRYIIGDRSSTGANGFTWRLNRDRMGFLDEDWNFTGGLVSMKAWHHVVVTKRGTGAGSGRYYCDGKVSGLSFDAGAGIVGADILQIGNGGPSQNSPWDGRIDEVRFESVSRSSNWLWARWLNEGANSSFNNYGPMQHTRMADVDNYPGATNAALHSAWLNGSLTSTGLAPASVWVYWGTNDNGATAAGWSGTNSVASSPAAPGVQFTVQATGLIQDRIYYYRYAAENAYGTNWASTAAAFITGELQVGSTNSLASETGPIPGSFTVYRPITMADAAMTVNYTMSGTALNGIDYVTLPGSVVMQAGMTNADITLMPIDDLILNQGNHAAVLNLARGSYVIGSQSNATVMIADNDAASEWSFKMKITFNQYNKPETLTNFPALVVLDENLSSFTYKQFASPIGGDLRFVNSNETSFLNHEIESWGAGTATKSYVWVQVPEFKSNCYIWAYWGSPKDAVAPAYTTNGASWTSGFRAVWHMNEADAKDSTARGHDGTQVSGVTPEADAAIGFANKFNGTSQYIAVSNSTDFQLNDGGYSFSAWVKTPGIGGQQGIFGNYDSCFSFGLNGGNVSLRNSAAWLGTSAAIAVDTWHLVTATRSGTNLVLYVDGVQKAVVASDGLDINSAAKVLELGSSGPDNRALFNGMIDEARIESVQRSSNWVWACWMNQGSNATFNVYTPVRYLGTAIFIR